MDRERRILPEIKTGARSPLARRVLTACQAVIAVVACGIVAASFGGQWLRTLGENLSALADGAADVTGVRVTHILTPDLDGKQRQAVIDASGIAIGTNMFAASPQRIRERIETIDAIGTAHVARIWPDTVVIVVQPRTAAAVSSDGTNWAVLDRTGRVIQGVSADDHTDLLRLFGVRTPAAAKALFSALDQHRVVRGYLRLAERVDGRRWDLHLTSGARLALPETDWRARLGDIEALHQAYRLLDLDLDRIDARIAHSIAITLPGLSPDKRRS